MTDRLCKHCGKPLVRKPEESHVNFVRRKCCSHSCATKEYIANIDPSCVEPKKCLACDALFSITPGQSEASFGLQRFCGRRCRARHYFHHSSPTAVYQIRNKTTGKVYIGSTVNIKHRWRHHHRMLRLGRHRSPYLQRAWNKYGPDDFEFTILEVVDDESVLLQREQEWMDTTQCCDPSLGYNLSPTAGNTLGIFPNEATRKKLSKALKGKNIGSKHGTSKLTEEQVAVIKVRIVAGDTLESIAQDYDVCFQTIGLIKTGCTWTHVPGPSLSPEETASLMSQNRRGERNGASVLTKQEVIEIKHRLAAGETCSSIAKDYPVSRSPINRIKLGRNWSHV